MAKLNSLDRVRAAKAPALAVFSKLAEVVGIGITTIDSQYGLKVNLAEPPEDASELPKEIDGVPVRIEVVGKIHKRSPQ